MYILAWCCVFDGKAFVLIVADGGGACWWTGCCELIHAFWLFPGVWLANRLEFYFRLIRALTCAPIQTRTGTWICWPAEGRQSRNLINFFINLVQKMLSGRDSFRSLFRVGSWESSDWLACDNQPKSEDCSGPNYWKPNITKLIAYVGCHFQFGWILYWILALYRISLYDQAELISKILLLFGVFI